MTFTKNGIKYFAEKGICIAKKESDDSYIWRVFEVFKENEITEKKVLKLAKLMKLIG